MPLSDAAIVGQPIIADENFGEGFRDDFDTLDVETSSTPGNRTGAWKQGFLAANVTQYGYVYGSDENTTNGDNFVHAAINFEDQVYPDTRKPNVYGSSGLAVSDSVLTITSRPKTSAEDNYARVKDYELNADGTLGTFSRNHPVAYTSEMLSKYGRFAMSFGRFRARVKTPYGADGSSSDVNQRKAVFPAALWLLQDVPYGCDINGDPFGDGATTYRPGRPNGGGILHEIDADENFGESTTALHQTVHAHPAGTAQGVSDSDPLTITLTKDLRNDWRETGVDIFPEKIAFFVDGVYTHVVDTTDEIENGLPLYVPEPGEEYDPVMVDPTTAQTNGRQTHPDGSTRYMRHVPIINLARNGKYPRDLAKQVVDSGGTLPPHQETVSMEVDWVEAKVLLTDNPDTLPLSYNGVATAVSTETVEESAGGRLVIVTQPSISQGRPSQQLIAVPKDGYDPTGKTFTWSSSVPELTFSPQGTLVTTPSLSGLSADVLATITIDDGEA